MLQNCPPKVGHNFWGFFYVDAKRALLCTHAPHQAYWQSFYNNTLRRPA
jgi:hypothetical protein